MEKIEKLRHQMVEEAFTQGSFTHESVVALSEQLDKYIVMYQKIKFRLPLHKTPHPFAFMAAY